MRTVALGLVAIALIGAACQAPSAAPARAPAGAPSGDTAGGAAPARSPEVERLLAAARQNGEDELRLSWGEPSAGGREGAARFETLFNQMYGTNIRVHFTQGPSMRDMAAKVAQEAAAGQKASTDLFLGGSGDFLALAKQDVLEPYDYTQLAPRILPEIVVHGNIGVTIYNTAAGITYNTNLVQPAEVPRRLADVLQPKWKGSIASSATVSYFDVISMRPEWGAEAMKGFIGRLSDQIGGLIRIGEEARVASGEFSMMVLSNDHNALVQRDKGAPVGFAIPEDAAVMQGTNGGVPRNSTNPNLAKLYILTMVSEEGQRALYEMQHVDVYALPGSQAGVELRALKARGVPIVADDVKLRTENPDMAQLTPEFTRILRERRPD
jgi:iron(III) transport system substrate-binding protein